MTWLPKPVVCLRYYDLRRFRSDLVTAVILALQVFPIALAIAIASGVPPVHGVYCAALASFVSCALGDSKIRVSSPNIIFVAVASTIVSREGVLGLSFSTLLAGVLLMGFGAAPKPMSRTPASSVENDKPRTPSRETIVEATATKMMLGELTRIFESPKAHDTKLARAAQ